MRMSRTKPRGGVKEKHEEKAASYQLIAVSGKVRFGRLRGDTGEIRLQPWQNSPTSLNSSLDPSALEPLLLRSELDPNPSCPPTFPHPEQGHPRLFRLTQIFPLLLPTPTLSNVLPEQRRANAT